MTLAVPTPAPPRAPTPEDLRAFRARHGLSQRALAEALGVSTRGVEDWEGGRRAPAPYLALALERLEGA